MSNQNLRDYVHALISIIRGNPSIIDKNAANIVAPGPRPLTYGQRYGLKPAVNMDKSSVASTYLLLANSLNNQVQLEDLNHQYNPFNDAVDNLYYGQVGGNPDVVHSTNYQASFGTNQTKLFNTLVDGLHDAGIALEPSEKNKIDESLKILSTAEIHVAKTIFLLKTLLDYARNLDLHDVPRNKPRKPLKLDNVKTKADMENFLASMTDILREKLDTGKSLQFSISNDTNRMLAKIAMLLAKATAPVQQQPTVWEPLSD